MPSSQGLMPLNPTSYAVLALCILNTVLSLLTLCYHCWLRFGVRYRHLTPKADSVCVSWSFAPNMSIFRSSLRFLYPSSSSSRYSFVASGIWRRRENATD